MSPVRKPASKRKILSSADGVSKVKQTARAALDSQDLSKSAIKRLIEGLEKLEKDVKDKDKALEDKGKEIDELQGRLDDKEQEIEELQGMLDDKDLEIEGLEEDDEHKQGVILELESELMEFNADNSEFVLECELEEEKERTLHLEQTKAGLETEVARYKMQCEIAAETASEQEGKIHHLKLELVEEKSLHAGSKDAKKKLDRFEKQWASVKRLMDEKPKEVFMKVEVKREEN